jgi:hypothetical protein
MKNIQNSDIFRYFRVVNPIFQPAIDEQPNFKSRMKLEIFQKTIKSYFIPSTNVIDATKRSLHRKNISLVTQIMPFGRNRRKAAANYNVPLK